MRKTKQWRIEQLEDENKRLENLLEFERYRLLKCELKLSGVIKDPIKKDNKKCVSQILDSLCNRNGFDDWWYDLDDEIKSEIEDELSNIIN